MPVKQEWVEKIKEAISRAYREGRIENFVDFDRIFNAEWDSLGVSNGRLKAGAIQSVMADNAVVRLLRKREKGVFQPIILKSPLAHLPLSVRASNSLFRAGIKSVGDIVALLKEDGEDGLIGIRNIGAVSAREVYDALEWAGIEISEPLDFSGEEGSEKSGGVARVKPEKKPVEAVPSQRRIYLEAGEIFKTKLSSEDPSEIILIFPDLSSLGIRARRITVEAEG